MASVADITVGVDPPMPVDITKGEEPVEVPVGKAPVELVETVVEEVCREVVRDIVEEGIAGGE